ncbi:MinD/ParA family ATP-binding protein [Sinomonas sp. P47F7]|uniref:MinD/ParA family ATP-binding protein n=2 Tax=unclassified Sinomonas TaxID=2646595 RepID=UPI003BF4E59C
MSQINAVLTATGEAHITGSDGRTWTTAFADLDAARESVRETAAATAAAIDEPVHLVISEPAGEQRVLVHANGDAEVDAPYGSAGPMGSVGPMDQMGSVGSSGPLGSGGPSAHTSPVAPEAPGASPDSPSLPPSPAPGPAHAAPMAQQYVAAPAPDSGPHDTAELRAVASGLAAASGFAAPGSWAPQTGIPDAVPVAPAAAPQAPAYQAHEGAGQTPPQAAPDEAPLQTRRRRPTAADFAASRPAVPQSPAREGWRGATNALTGGALRLAPGDEEMTRREWRASIQRGLAGHKCVVFVNLKGGASKTTTCYLTAATLGRVRGGNVLAWDNNENKGTLGDRALSAGHDHTAIDLLANIDRFMNPANAHELVNFVRAQGENKFHVLASQNQAGDKEVIDGGAFVRLHTVLRQFYHLALVDTGNASTAATWQAAVEIADEIVLVSMNKEDSSKTLAATVDTLIEMGFADKLSRGVLLVTQPPVPSKNRKTRLAANGERLHRIREHFGHYVRKIVVAPYDEALDDGADIIFENLAPATQEAYLEATASIIDGL